MISIYAFIFVSILVCLMIEVVKHNFITKYVTHKRWHDLLALAAALIICYVSVYAIGYFFDNTTRYLTFYFLIIPTAFMFMLVHIHFKTWLQWLKLRRW